MCKEVKRAAQPPFTHYFNLVTRVLRFARPTAAIAPFDQLAAIPFLRLSWFRSFFVPHPPKGSMVYEAKKEWAPNGWERLRAMITGGFFDTGESWHVLSCPCCAWVEAQRLAHYCCRGRFFCAPSPPPHPPARAQPPYAFLNKDLATLTLTSNNHAQCSSGAFWYLGARGKDVGIFRCVKAFVLQFGIHGDPVAREAMAFPKIADDKVVESNKKGWLTFASSGKHSRTTQLFFNLKHNKGLDKKDFAPVARCVLGCNVLDKITLEYGQKPKQGLLKKQGNSYLQSNFPNLDYITAASFVPAPAAVPAADEEPPPPPPTKSNRAPTPSRRTHGVNFTVAWEPAKRAPSSAEAEMAKPPPPPWEKAAAEAARRIRAAESVVSADVERKAMSAVNGLKAKVRDAGKKVEKSKTKGWAQPDQSSAEAQLRDLKEKLASAESTHQAIVDAEAHLVEHHEGGGVVQDHAEAHHSEKEPEWVQLVAALETASKISFESCTASLAGKPAKARAKTLQNPNWIHIPKAGTTFATTLYAYLCTSEPHPAVSPDSGQNCTWCGPVGKRSHGSLQWDPKTWPLIPFDDEPYCDWNVPLDSRRVFSNHFSVPGHKTPGTLLTLLRDPRQRLVSAWNNNKHSYGASGGHRRLIEQAQTLREFVEVDGVAGCQTKMVLGMPCAGKIALTSKQLEGAKAVLETQFAFVGLTGSFNASICLFHHMFGGVPREYTFRAVGLERSSDFLFKHYHRTPKYKPLPGGGKRVPAEAWKELSTEVDPFDWQLYQTAARVFVARLRDAGLLP